MAQCMCKMVLDVSERDTLYTIVARQGDSGSRGIRLRLTSFGEALRVEENTIPVLNVKNTSDEVRAFTGEVNADGSITLPLTAWMLRTTGILVCDVSLFDEAGNKLTTPPFEVEVVASVVPGEVLPGDDDGGESVTAEIIAQEHQHELVPVKDNDMFLLLPQCRRRYTLGFLKAVHGDNDGWKHIQLVLPAVSGTDKENWILISCHTPSLECGPIPIDWGNADRYLFVGGTIPVIETNDFDIICTYSHHAGKWLIGVVQYGAAGEAG